MQAEQQKNVSRSTTEAASCGIPIVALNMGREDYGFFTTNKKEAIEELSKLIKDKNYRLEKGKIARKIIIENFSEDKIYTKFLEFLKDVK